jgi:hypothetical protein
MGSLFSAGILAMIVLSAKALGEQQSSLVFQF